jgi:hypothetical protein
VPSSLAEQLHAISVEGTPCNRSSPVAAVLRLPARRAADFVQSSQLAFHQAFHAVPSRDTGSDAQGQYNAEHQRQQADRGLALKRLATHPEKEHNSSELNPANRMAPITRETTIIWAVRTMPASSDSGRFSSTWLPRHSLHRGYPDAQPIILNSRSR